MLQAVVKEHMTEKIWLFLQALLIDHYNKYIEISADNTDEEKLLYLTKCIFLFSGREFIVPTSYIKKETSLTVILLTFRRKRTCESQGRITKC